MKKDLQTDKDGYGYVFFPGQANKIAKEAANRWTGMYYNGTAKLQLSFVHSYYDVKCKSYCAQFCSRKDISGNVCIKQVFIY